MREGGEKGEELCRRREGEKVEIPFAWCQIARVRTCCPSASRICMKSGWAQSCRDLALLYLLPKCYRMLWKSSLQFIEDLCIKDVQEASSSAERHRGKKIRKFILIFQLCLKMSDSSEVSFHMILIIPCHTEIFLL